jgi:hypothetical protein
MAGIVARRAPAGSAELEGGEALGVAKMDFMWGTAGVCVRSGDIQE